MEKISNLKGIGKPDVKKLSAAGIDTLNDLLEKCGPAKARAEVAKATGIDKKQLLIWANHADLFRIKGVGTEYSHLLEAAGVDSCKELASRKAVNLTRKIEEVNTEEQLVKKIPTQSMVEDWISQAKSLPKVVTH
jgi:predicted flap endonuclease-1-like 5' DNA nuclease